MGIEEIIYERVSDQLLAALLGVFNIKKAALDIYLDTDSKVHG